MGGWEALHKCARDGSTGRPAAGVTSEWQLHCVCGFHSLDIVPWRAASQMEGFVKVRPRDSAESLGVVFSCGGYLFLKLMLRIVMMVMNVDGLSDTELYV